MKKYVTVALSVLLAASSSMADETQPAEPCSMAVLELVPQGLPESQQFLAKVLSTTLAKELAEITECRVLSDDEIKSVTSFEAQKQLCGNEDASCLAELGEAMGVQKIVSGQLSKIGTTFSLQTRIVDIEKVVVLGRSERDVADVEALKFEARQSARELLGQNVIAAKTESAPKGGSVLLPVTLLGIGAAMAATGCIGMLLADGTLGQKDALTEDKDTAILIAWGSLGAVAVGTALALVGGGLFFIGGSE